MLSARIIKINNREEAQKQLAAINCDSAGVNIMARKAVFKVVKLEGITTKAANLLKQTFLAKGGEVAVARGTADLSVEFTDVLICATMKQYQFALAQLKQQPWGLPQVAAAIENILQQEAEFPTRRYSWQDKQLSIEPGRTLVMGILNVTPDSFSDGGRYNNLAAAVQHVQEMIAAGADIIDIGAESTRPYGSKIISAQEEADRLLPVLEKVLPVCSVPVSIDTYKASVAEAALKMGAHIINDIWGLQYDAGMADVIAKYNVPVVIMHNQETSTYNRDIMSEIGGFLEKSIAIGTAAGITADKFIVDPGIGFAKNTPQNLAVLARLDELKSLGCPILLGTCRKRFIGDVLDLAVNEREEGTAATVAYGICHGAQIVRVHNVKVMARIAKMTDAIKEYM